MRVVTTGSREWTSRSIIRAVILEAHSDMGITIVIHGGARGADRLVGEVCLDLSIPVRAWAADWKVGKSAGIQRNIRMIESEPDLVIAFWDGESRGTSQCYHYALALGIPVWLVQEDGLERLLPRHADITNRGASTRL